MANLTKEMQLVFVDIGVNSNKVWIGELYDDDTVITRWGRIREGANGAMELSDMQSKTFPSAGESFLLKKEREKLKKGYTHTKTVKGGATASAPAKAQGNLDVIARQQLLKSNNPQLAQLIDRLVRANIHNITSQTKITYNAATGLFQTPLGVVTQEGVDEARNLLVEIKKAMIGKKEMTKLVSQYMRIIPQDVGFQKLRVELVFPDLDAVEKQSDILDSLEASYKALLTTPPKPQADGKAAPVEKVFEVDLDVLTDPKEQRRLEDYYHKSMKSMHGYGHVKIRQMFSVKVHDMDKGYDHKLGNDTEVYHGTSQANLLSILKSGLKTAPPSTAYIAGKMFGNGIYGAINSSKSLGYTFGRWGGSSGDSGWLFVCDFAMGKIHEPSSTCSRPPAGYDSVWAKASKVGLNHDELIVYRNNQVNIKYLLECK